MISRAARYVETKLRNQVKAFSHKHLSLQKGKKGFDYQIETIFFNQIPPISYQNDDRLSPTLATNFEAYSSRKEELQLVYLYRYTEQCYIEPEHFWVISAKNKKVIPESQPYRYYPLPTQLSLRKRERLKTGKVVLLWNYYQNYYHFLVDIIGQVVMAEQSGLIDKHTQYLIPGRAFEFAFVNDLFQSCPAFKNLNWLVLHNHQLLKAEEVLIPKSVGLKKSTLTDIANYLQLPVTAEARAKKIFITRPKTRPRTLENLEAVESLLRANGFIVVNTEELSVAQQASLFRNAEIVVAVHGASLANLVFGKEGSLHLMELFPANYNAPYYYWIANELGFGYDALVGTALNSGQQFSVDLGILEEKIKRQAKFSINS